MPFTSSQILSHWVTENWDQHSPFREEAESRSIFLAGVDGSAMTTRAGFFSLCVFRGITFNTPFLQEHKLTYFLSLDNWKEAIQPLLNNHPASYFCNLMAYSQNPIAQRKIQNAEMYWEESKKWEDLVNKFDGQIPFDKAFDFLSKEIKLPGIGDLVRLLILGESSVLKYLY